MLDNEDKTLSVKLLGKQLPINEAWLSILEKLTTFALAIVSVILAISSIDGNVPLPILVIVIASILFGAVIVFYHLRILFQKKRYNREYNRYVASEKISKALLTSLKRIDYDKTSYILQSTYGRVAEWHPIDYGKNVLVYDVHQHLREICVSLKELVIGLSPDFNDDMVTVDLVWCYPSDFVLKKKAGVTSLYGECRWRLITSGDHTASDVNLHEYLADIDSFYTYVQERGCVFANDKKAPDITEHYKLSHKDTVYSDKPGSAVGLTIELRNDEPEVVFVRAILTITTYGRKFVEKGDSLDEEQFEKLFNEVVLNCYKTLIESEFSQMFIRHGILEGYINPKTGGFIKNNDKKRDKKIADEESSALGTPTAPSFRVPAGLPSSRSPRG